MWNLGGWRGTHCLREFQYLTHGFRVYIVDFVDFNIIAGPFGAACIYFQTWSVIFVIRPTNDSRHFIITNKGLTQSVNELLTFLIVFYIFEFCSANLTVNGSVDWLIDPLKLFSRAYDVDISDDLLNGLGFTFSVIRFYFAFHVFYCTYASYIFTLLNTAVHIL